MRNVADRCGTGSTGWPNTLFRSASMSEQVGQYDQEFGQYVRPVQSYYISYFFLYIDSGLVMHEFSRFRGSDNDVARLHRRQSAQRGQKRKKPQSESTAIPKPKPRQKFVRGPIPLNWLHAALKLGDKSGHLAWVLWFLAGITGKNPIRVTSALCKEFHISPRTTARLLERFAKAGLLSLDRRRGRGPDVTLSEVEPQSDAE